MENEYIERLQDLIDRYNIQLVSYNSNSPSRFYALQSNRLVHFGEIMGEKLILWIPENTLQSSLEQAWYIAHELGHAMLGHHLYEENNDLLKRECDAWDKAEFILVSYGIPLQATDREWTFSESFFTEKQWALKTYEDAERKGKESEKKEALAATKPPVDVKPTPYAKYIWIQIKQLLRFLWKSIFFGFALIGLLFIMDAPQMYQLACDPDGIRSLVSSVVIVYPSIYVSMFIVDGVVKSWRI